MKGGGYESDASLDILSVLGLLRHRSSFHADDGFAPPSMFMLRTERRN